MLTYSCQTCSEQLDDLGKHISQTRHKTIVYNPLVEQIECEECEDSNINILKMVRYGYSDMALLCLECLLKQPGELLAEYSLSNGSLFQKLPQYFKFRDIECETCHKASTLWVANNKTGQKIVCRACLKEHEADFKNYECTSEESDDFLSALLGIKEYVPKGGNKNRGRQRKIGRKGGRLARPKKVDPNAEQRKAHYENKKATEAALKSGKTIKAVGSGGPSPAISRSVTPVPVKRSFAGKQEKKLEATKLEGKKPEVKKQDVKKSEAQGVKKTDARKEKKLEARKSNTKKDIKSTIKTAIATDSKSSSPKSGDDRNARPGNSAKKPESQKTSKDKTPVEKPQQKVQSSKLSSIETDGKTSKKSRNPREDSPKTKDSKKPDKPKKKDIKVAGTNNATLKSEARGNSDGKKSPGRQDSRSMDTITKEKLAKDPQTNLNGSKSLAELQPIPAITLPPGITKYEPAKSPPLTYDSMDQYFNEMCYNLFLEEKSSMYMSNNSMLVPGEFDLEWYADQDRKHKQFKINVLMTLEILDRYVSRKMQNLKKTPFNVGQSLMLVLGEDIPWYGNIVLAESRIPKSAKPPKFKKGRRPPKYEGPKMLEIIVELYKWNKQPLPLSVNVNLLRVLPVSVPVSRVFLAMSRILNPKFIDMILGKKPIRQIFFKNYLKFTKDTFNDSQKVAMQSVLNNSITVLQGPPGTGKTSTIYEIILQLLDNLNTFPILVVAASNIAIDNIAEKLLEKHGRSILRIVSNEKEPEYSRDHPLASICLHHKVYDGLPAQIQDLIKEMKRPGSKISQTLYKKVLSAQIDYSDKLIALARVIFTTTVVAGGNQLKSVPKIPVVIMDEATQSSEPTTLIPLSVPGVEKFVFVGDQKQLSSFSQVPNLSLSLFERILLNGSYQTPHMLDTQYRMHPAISEFPRNKFYDGLLKDGITAENRQREGIPPNPVVFWDTCGKSPEMHVHSRFREDSGLTYANAGEIKYIEKVLTNLIFEKSVKKADIGVITPYRGQRDKISSTLVKNELINPEKLEVHVEIDRDDFFNESKPITIHTVSDIMIASIDAFQGREKDFLVMSCVRSNPNNKIGFLNDARRMNVALTRAKYGLILIGDVECLSKADPLWKEYLDALKERNLILRSDSFAYN